MLSTIAIIGLIFIQQAQPSQQQPATSYREAYDQCEREKRPLLAVISAKWCGSCQVMKRDTILPMLRDKEFRDVVVVIIDKDQEPELAAKLMQGETLPQTILIDRPGPNRKQFALPGTATRSRIKELLQKIFK